MITDWIKCQETCVLCIYKNSLRAFWKVKTQYKFRDFPEEYHRWWLIELYSCQRDSEHNFYSTSGQHLWTLQLISFKGWWNSHAYMHFFWKDFDSNLVYFLTFFYCSETQHGDFSVLTYMSVIYTYYHLEKNNNPKTII